MACKLLKGRIKTCAGMAAVLEYDDGRGTRHQGAKLQSLMDMKTGKFTRQWIVLKSGEYSKTGIIMNYCPFCRALIYKSRKRGER
jgi:hypothetical protein